MATYSKGTVHTSTLQLTTSQSVPFNNTHTLLTAAAGPTVTRISGWVNTNSGFLLWIGPTSTFNEAKSRGWLLWNNQVTFYVGASASGAVAMTTTLQVEVGLTLVSNSTNSYFAFQNYQIPPSCSVYMRNTSITTQAFSSTIDYMTLTQT